jgi:hypothetical protein
VGKQEALLAESSTMDDAVEKYLNLTSYYGQQVEMDKEGSDAAAAASARESQVDRGRCRAAGSCTTSRFITSRVLEESLQANALTAEDRQSLAAILKRHSGQ